MTNTQNTHTTVSQNAAHRADLVWIKVSAEYIRSDGVTIRKNHNTGRWVVYLANGEAAPMMVAGKTYPAYQMSAHNLTWAKLEAEQVNA